MSSVTYDATTNLASVGPGGKWMNVYRTLLEGHNVAVVGGRDGDVGVGGFTTGGEQLSNTRFRPRSCETLFRGLRPSASSCNKQRSVIRLSPFMRHPLTIYTFDCRWHLVLHSPPRLRMRQRRFHASGISQRIDRYGQ
jgi:hypothetical protein